MFVRLIKLTSSERKLIKDHAYRLTRNWDNTTIRRIRVGTRISLDENVILTPNVNVWVLTDIRDDRPNNTDLYNNSMTFGELGKIELADDKRALIDFYIYDRENELLTNMQAELDENGLVAIHTDSNMNIWRRS